MSQGPQRCPCGKPRAATCDHCGRALCAEHRAWTPTGGPKLHPACFPRCEAPWWRTAALEGLVDATAHADEEARGTLKHAGRLLARGAEVDAVAAELGLSETRVRDMARRLKPIGAS